MAKMWNVISILVLVFASAVLSYESPLVRKNVAKFEKIEDLEDYKLPRNVEPTQYTVHLEPELSEPYPLKGKVDISAKVINPTNIITLHSDGLIHKKEDISVMVDDIELLSEVSQETEYHFLHLHLSRALKKDELVQIRISYSGNINTQANEGFYIGEYMEGTTKKYFATTQFEPTYARKAFPCFDEAYFKATFVLEILRDKSLNTVSNTKIAESRPDATGKVLDVYKPTQLMSPYLLAFHLSDFKHLTSTDSMHEVYGSIEKIDRGDGLYALELSPVVMKVMEEFTGIKNYLHEKMSQIGVADSYFDFGAMENWGAVIYRESLLLFQEGVSTTEDRHKILSVIAHEYSHQWFGNLATPAWWTWLWLSEGFATYFEHYVTHVIAPEYRYDERYVVVSNHRAMKDDAKKTTRPMSYEVAAPLEIKALFDTIAYQKSGAVIRMMEHFLTTPVFQQMLRNYLSNNMFKIANEDDLYQGLPPQPFLHATKLPDNDFAGLMKSWTQQEGYPLVKIIRNSDGSIGVTQKRFMTDGNSADTIWKVPLTYSKAESDFADTTTKMWLVEKDGLLPVTVAEDEWIVVNNMAVGYYRVDYGNLWPSVIRLLKSAEFEIVPPVNRAQILDDAFKLALTQDISMDTLMSLLEYIEQETDFIPLYTYTNNINELQKYLYGMRYYNDFKNIIKASLQAAYKKLGTNRQSVDKPIDKINRQQVWEMLCKYEDSTCLSDTLKILKEGSTIDPDLQEVVYCGAARSGAESYEILKSLLQKTSNEHEQKRISRGMGCTGDEATAYMILNNTLNKIVLNTLEKELVTALIANEVGLSVAIVFMDTNNEILVNHLEILQEISAKISSSTHISLLKSILDKLPNEEPFKETKEVVSENIKTTEDWVKNKGKLIDSYLQKKYHSSNGGGIVQSSFVFSLFLIIVGVFFTY